MERAFSWTSLSPTVCLSDCLSVSLTLQPPAHVGLPVCMHALILLLIFFFYFFNPDSFCIIVKSQNENGYKLGMLVYLLIFSLPSFSQFLPLRLWPSLSKQKQSQKTIKPNCVAKHFYSIHKTKWGQGLFYDKVCETIQAVVYAIHQIRQTQLISSKQPRWRFSKLLWLCWNKKPTK